MEGLEMKTRTVRLCIKLDEREAPDAVQIGRELAALTDRRDLSDDELHAIGQAWLTAIHRAIG
jgi:hypothetical protein